MSASGRIAVVALALLLLPRAPLGSGSVPAGAPGERRSDLDRYDLADPRPPRFTLPAALNEISGLAVTSDDRLFAHNDERGVVYQLDHRTGRVVKWFALGRHGVADDFEGLAIVGARFFLATSAGTLYEASEGAHGAAVPYTRHATGLGRLCEVEGLAYDPETRALLLPCKTPRARALRGQVSVYAVPLASMRLDARPRFAVPLAALAGVAGKHGFHPSSIERNPRTHTFFLLSAKAPALVELDAAGRVLGARPLPQRAHPQAEGVAFTRDGTLVISDEARGGPASITLYAAAAMPRPPSSSPDRERKP